jgi:hypothetical protein
MTIRVLKVFFGELDDSVGRALGSLSEFAETLLALVFGEGDRTQNQKD